MSCATPKLDLTALAVDDDPANLRVFEQIFQTFGARVTTAARGLEALSLLERRSFDVAVVDIHMPEMSGFDLIRRVRGRPGLNQLTPAIAVTADVFSRRRGEFLEAGFDAYLPKPVSVTTLVETARRLADGERPRQIVASDLISPRLGAAHGNVTAPGAGANLRLA